MKTDLSGKKVTGQSIVPAKQADQLKVLDLIAFEYDRLLSLSALLTKAAKKDHPSHYLLSFFYGLATDRTNLDERIDLMMIILHVKCLDLNDEEIPAFDDIKGVLNSQNIPFSQQEVQLSELIKNTFSGITFRALAFCFLVGVQAFESRINSLSKVEQDSLHPGFASGKTILSELKLSSKAIFEDYLHKYQASIYPPLIKFYNDVNEVLFYADTSHRLTVLAQINRLLNERCC